MHTNRGSGGNRETGDRASIWRALILRRDRDVDGWVGCVSGIHIYGGLTSHDMHM